MSSGKSKSAINIRPKTMTSADLLMTPTAEAFYKQLQPSSFGFAKRHASIPLDLVKEDGADDPTDFGDLLNVKSEDHNALYSLRYDAVGQSGVLSQEEIEAMSISPPLPPAVGSFPDAVFIDHKFK